MVQRSHPGELARLAAECAEYVPAPKRRRRFCRNPRQRGIGVNSREPDESGQGEEERGGHATQLHANEVVQEAREKGGTALLGARAGVRSPLCPEDSDEASAIAPVGLRSLRTLVVKREDAPVGIDLSQVDAYLISLPRDLDRCAEAKRTLSSLGIERVTVIPGMPGMDIVSEVHSEGKVRHRAVLNSLGVELTGRDELCVRVRDIRKVPGTLGCTLAHASVCNRIIQTTTAENDTEWVGIFEDDIQIAVRHGNPDTIAARVTSLTNVETISRIDIIWLGGIICWKQVEGSLLKETDGYGLFERALYQTHSFLIRRRAVSMYFKYLREGSPSDGALTRAARTVPHASFVTLPGMKVANMLMQRPLSEVRSRIRHPESMLPVGYVAGSRVSASK